MRPYELFLTVAVGVDTWRSGGLAGVLTLSVCLKRASSRKRTEALKLGPEVRPVVPVIIVILAFNFLGDGLQDALDPRAARR